MVIVVKLKRKKSKSVVVEVPRPVKELNAQQKNLSILQEDKQGATAFFVYGLQDARFVTAASSQISLWEKNATAFAVVKWNTIWCTCSSPVFEHRCSTFTWTWADEFFDEKARASPGIVLAAVWSRRTLFLSDLLSNLKKYSFGQDLIGPASLFLKKAVGRRMNYQKKKEDERKELQKRTESTREVKVQKLEIREALLGKKSSESIACLVVAQVHSLDRLDCDFILYGTGMLMVVVKLFNDQRRKESSSSARSTLCSGRKEKIWEDFVTAWFFVGSLFSKKSKTVRRLV